MISLLLFPLSGLPYRYEMLLLSTDIGDGQGRLHRTRHRGPYQLQKKDGVSQVDNFVYPVFPFCPLITFPFRCMISLS